MKAPRVIGRRVSLLSIVNDLFTGIETLVSSKPKSGEDSPLPEKIPPRPSSSRENHLR